MSEASSSALPRRIDYVRKSPTYLEIRDVAKGFDGTPVLRSFSLGMEKGEFVTLLGPSGCGKTTLLRLIAGLMRVDSGSISVGGRDLTKLPAHRRNVGIVFQSYALFPHLSVWENIAFGLKAKHADAAMIKREVGNALEMVQLASYGTRSVRALSGGQQQRVSLARAIVTKPAVMLLDEPFSALDRNLRESMQIETRHLLRQIGATALFVTHDQQEALVMSDRIVVINQGQVEQIDTPKNIYSAPATPFVLGFVGQALRLSGRVESIDDDRMVISTALGTIRAVGSLAVGARVLVAARPESVELAAGTAEHNCVTSTVRDVIFQGPKTTVLLESPTSDAVAAETSGTAPDTLAIGERTAVRWPITQTLVFGIGE